MTQTSTTARIAAADLRLGDIIVNEAGQRLYAAFDVDARPTRVRVFTALADQEAGQPRMVELLPDDTLLIALPPACDACGRAQATCEADLCETYDVLTATAPLDATPEAVNTVILAAFHPPIDIRPVGQHATRVTFRTHDRARAVAAHLIRAGYAVARTGARLTVTPDDPYFD